MIGNRPEYYINNQNFDRNQSLSHFLSKSLAMLVQTCTDWRESRSRLGLETEVYETLGLVSVSCEILNHVQSRSRSRVL